jgi:16S rRNA (cytosine1402-N4)-methyltransferase
MSPKLKVTAADLINGLTKKELNELFSKLGQEHHSWRIAEAVCRARELAPLETTDRLAEVITRSRPKRRRRERIHPATRVFQALRIAVNDELNNLIIALPQALALLKTGGRLAVISFHSGEDGIVKRFFREKAEKGLLDILTKKPIRPGEAEVRRNPKSRSARLRVAEKKNNDQNKKKKV